MSLTIVVAIVAALVVGALAAAQPPINAELAKHTSILGAAAISAGVTFLILAGMLLLIGEWRNLNGLGSIPPIYLTGGLAGAAFVGISLVAVRHLGAGGLVAAMVCAQLIVALLLDRIGAFGLEETPITPLRFVGAAALVIGTLLLTWR